MVVLVLLLFLSVVGGSVCSLLSDFYDSGLSRLDSARPYYLADAGLQWALRNRQEPYYDVSFGAGSFSIDKYMWRFTVTAGASGAERRVRGYRTIEFFPGTRADASPEDVWFWVQNQTGYWIDFNYITLEWSGATAYYAKILMTEEGDEDLDTYWDYGWSGGWRAGSGDKISLNRRRWLAPFETIEIKIEDFEAGRYGGSDVDMRDIPVKLTFHDYSYAYQPTVVGVD